MSFVPVAYQLIRRKCRIKQSLVLPFYTYFFVIGFLLPLAVISVLYTIVARKLWLHEMPVDHNVSENQREQEIPKKKVIRMLIIVVVVFAVCWLPVHVYQMHEGVSTDGALGIRMYLFTFATGSVRLTAPSIRGCILV